MKPEFVKALIAAQRKFAHPNKNKTNPHFQSKYADLPAVIDAVKNHLHEEKIAFVQSTKIQDGFLVLVTELHHESGDSFTSEYPVCSVDVKPADKGSALTYARRYTLSAICGIASEDDDDGQRAQRTRDDDERVMLLRAASTKFVKRSGITQEQYAELQKLAGSSIYVYLAELEESGAENMGFDAIKTYVRTQHGAKSTTSKVANSLNNLPKGKEEIK